MNCQRPSQPEQVPESMRNEPRWVLWKYEGRGGGTTKIPLQPNGKPARSNDCSTWTTFEQAFTAAEASNHGLGFMLGDGWAGVDLDHVRQGGELSDGSKAIIESLESYTEVSPSGTGVKVFVRGQIAQGRRGKVDGVDVEVYGDGRYFTVTGQKLADAPITVAGAQRPLDQLLGQVGSQRGSSGPRVTPAWDDVPNRPHLGDYRKRVECFPEAVAGEGGHNATFHAACEIRRFGLNQEDSWLLMRHYNETRCTPTWDEERAHGANSLRRKFNDGCATVLAEGGNPRHDTNARRGAVRRPGLE